MLLGPQFLDRPNGDAVESDQGSDGGPLLRGGNTRPRRLALTSVPGSVPVWHNGSPGPMAQPRHQARGGCGYSRSVGAGPGMGADWQEAAGAWQASSVEAVFAAVGSGPAGLTSSEARARLQRCGPNTIQAAGRLSPWRILLEQFKNVLIIILLVATALSGAPRPRASRRS